MIMKNADFLVLLTANANKTSRIRVYKGPWKTSAAFLIEDEITNQIGRIVGFLQAKLNEFCKSDQMLLIYNFQPVGKITHPGYCSLQMVIKPLAEKDQTDKNQGIPIEIIVDGNTGRLMNSSKLLVEWELIEEAFLVNQGLEPPKEYGNYKLFQALTSFLTITSYKPLDVAEIFSGKYNDSEALQKGHVFDGFIEACHFLNDRKELGKYVAELACSREDIESIKRQGLSKTIIKIIQYPEQKAIVTTNPEALSKEARIEEEVQRLNEALAEESEIHRQKRYIR
jgi:hypothetical protein